MAEQFDMKLVGAAKYYTPRPEYRGKTWTRDHEEDSRGILPKEG